MVTIAIDHSAFNKITQTEEMLKLCHHFFLLIISNLCIVFFLNFINEAIVTWHPVTYPYYCCIIETEKIKDRIFYIFRLPLLHLYFKIRLRLLTKTIAIYIYIYHLSLSN